MATSATITWTPGGGPNVVTQDVLYRPYNPLVDGAWTTGASGLGPLVNSAVITAAFLDNTIYEFQVIDNCSAGGPTPSSSFNQIKITCPELAYSKTSTSLTVTITNQGHSIDKYIVKLYDTTGSVNIASQTKLPPFAATVVATFTGLTATTNYKVRVEVYAGPIFKKLDCPLGSVTLDAVPTCTPPTGVNVTMS